MMPRLLLRRTVFVRVIGGGYGLAGLSELPFGARLNDSGQPRHESALRCRLVWRRVRDQRECLQQREKKAAWADPGSSIVPKSGLLAASQKGRTGRQAELADPARTDPQ